MTLRLALPLMLTGTLALTSIGCTDDEDSNTVVDVAVADGNFTILASALQRTGLDVTLREDGPFTVLAPTDDAFARLPAGLLDQIDDATLREILLYHVIPGDAHAADVAALSSAQTVEGSDVSIVANGGGVTLNGITRVTATDVVADNGVIHVIDSVMLPPDMAFPGTLVNLAVAYPTFDTLVGAVADASLVDALSGDNGGSGFTLFAPTNDAFAALGIDLSTLSAEQLTNVLLYHVVGSTVNAAQVVTLSEAPTLQGSDIAIDVVDGGVVLNGKVGVVRTDIAASNGVAHVIDGVLIPSN